jgi:hypothetical protein
MDKKEKYLKYKKKYLNLKKKNITESKYIVRNINLNKSVDNISKICYKCNYEIKSGDNCLSCMWSKENPNLWLVF